MLARLRQGAGIFGAGRIGDAESYFESLRREALAAGEDDVAARATGNVGGCQFALHQYQPALRSFLEAHRLADQAGDASYTAVLDVNIASLYSEMGELEAAAQWIEGALERMSGKDRRDHLPQLLIQLATLRARQDRMPEAAELFRQGTDAADRAGDLELYALGWNRLGEEFLKRGDLSQAEAALLEAYRVRKLHRLALDSFVSQPGTSAPGAGRPGVRFGAAGPRRGACGASPGSHTFVGRLSFPRPRPAGAGPPPGSARGLANRGAPGARVALVRAAL